MKYLMAFFFMISGVSFANNCDTNYENPEEFNYLMRVNTCFNHPKACKHLNLTFDQARRNIYTNCGCIENTPYKDCPKFRYKEIRCENEIVAYECIAI